MSVRKLNSGKGRGGLDFIVYFVGNFALTQAIRVLKANIKSLVFQVIDYLGFIVFL